MFSYESPLKDFGLKNDDEDCPSMAAICVFSVSTVSPTCTFPAPASSMSTTTSIVLYNYLPTIQEHANENLQGTNKLAFEFYSPCIINKYVFSSGSPMLRYKICYCSLIRFIIKIIRLHFDCYNCSIKLRSTYILTVRKPPSLLFSKTCVRPFHIWKCSLICKTVS